MNIPGLSDLPMPAKNFARFIFLIILIAILYAIFNFGKNFLISKNFIQNDEENKAFLYSLKFDYKVNKVIDGDTIHIERLDGEKVEGVDKEVSVRLIGINTPETVDPRKPVECFGKEASDYMKSLAEGKVAAIEIDPSQVKFDQYGRLLAYVFIKNSGIFPNNIVFINEVMIKNGFAYEYTYNIPYKYQGEFKNLEREARRRDIGL